MRKVFLLGALTAVASLSLGCALTDYPSMTPTNKSHGIYDCTDSHDRIANTQQTTEHDYRDLFFRDPAVGGQFGPFLLTEQVDRATAREWGRFIGVFAAVTGAGVSGGADEGQWEMAGVKELADGTRRITTYFSSVSGGFPGFSCGFGVRSPSIGATEGGVLSQHLVPPAGASDPYMKAQSVALDNADGNQFNAPAVMDPSRAANGYSTLVGSNARVEYQAPAIPITRRSGASLGAALSGEVQTWQGPADTDLAGFTVSAWAEMTDEGIVAHLVGLTAPNGASYEAGETPVSILLGELGSRTYQVSTSPAESLKLALFAREAGIGDQVINLPKHVDGIPMPNVSLVIGADAIERHIDKLTEMLSGEGGAGFGG
jgi:hypothetical protein